MPPCRLLFGPALALGLSIVAFIPAASSEAVIVATGNLTPAHDDSDPWVVAGNLVVGYNAPATLQVDAASVVNSASGILAAYDESSGEVTVSGSGSAWNNSGALLVGRVGTGTLNIENGGIVTNTTFAYLGNGAAATGTVNVTGSGSAWNSSGELHIGRSNTGILNIEDGASVRTDGVTLLGYDAEASGSVLVTGADSVWETTGDIAVGSTGTGTLNIENGAAVSTDGISHLGIYAGSTGTATVTGAGSVWNANQDLNVGYYGSGTLNIENGATVSTSGGSRIGYGADSNGTVTVTGTGSVWNATNDLHIGRYGTGILNIENGATVNNNNNGASYIGYYAGSAGTATAMGAGTVWNNEYLYIGFRGTGTLNILNSGVVSTRHGSGIGHSTGSHGTVNIDDSLWSVSNDDLTIGHQGTGEVNIRHDGRVDSNIVRIGYSNTGIGTVRVSDKSAWELTTLFLGYLGQGTLLIEDGGRIDSTDVEVGYRAESVGVATVTGTESTWNTKAGMTVGNTGNGTLTIVDGGTVSVGNLLTLGEEADGIGIVNLAGGTLDLNGGELTAGLGDATFNFTGGILLNAGTIRLAQPFVQNGGTLAPGGSIGQTVIEGNYDLNAGTLEIELGGMGNPIDLVTVTSDIDIANTDTTLDLHALGPMAAGTYTALESTAGTITGMFENVSAFNLFGVNVTVQNTGNAITVTLDSNLIFADPNLDGFVGIDDLDIVLNHWNQTVVAGDILSGDLDGDGFVGLNDLDAVLNNWNAGTLPPETANVIPEPSSVGLMLLSVFGICRRGWTRAA